jgi:glycosyltransferase involved in cell wall biosynthesis
MKSDAEVDAELAALHEAAGVARAIAVELHPKFRDLYRKDAARWGPAIVKKSRAWLARPDVDRLKLDPGWGVAPAPSDPAGVNPAFRGPAPKPGDRVVIRAHLHAHGGYGQLAEWAGRGLEAIGVPVVYDPVAINEEFLDLQPFIRERIVTDPADDWELLFAVPDGHAKVGKTRVHFSMWEVSRLHPSMPGNVNTAALVCVPSDFSATVFSASGVNVPIRVVPLGVAADEGYRPTTGPRDDLVVFGTAGRMAHGGDRKGLVAVARAFVRAFPDQRDVRLRIKCWRDCLPKLAGLPQDPRIEVLTTPLSPEGMADETRSWTAGVFGTCGEGWGLHLHQTMAVGRPVVAPVASGQAHFFDARHGFPVPFRWTPARDTYSGYYALWAEPTAEGLVEGMRWVYEHPDDARARGQAGAARAAEFTWQRTARQLRDVLVEVGMIANPYRAAIERAKACLHREPIARCGCNDGATCKAGKGSWGDGFVSIGDCLRCVAS